MVPEPAPPKPIAAPSETIKLEAPPVNAPIAAPASRVPKAASPPVMHAAVPADNADQRQPRAPHKHTTRAARSKLIPLEVAVDSVATKTEFAVDLGGAATLEGLRTLWDSVRSNQSSLVDRMRPLIAVRESDKPGPVELRLVVGPLANAAAAARLCASFSSAGRICEPAVFDGQKLALR